QPAPPEPMLPARSPQMSRPSALGKPAPPEVAGALTACSKYQLTPYFRSPDSFTSTTCASMCTCSGITSRRSTTSRIERQACALERTSSVLVSSTVDTPTWLPSTSNDTEPLPGSRGSSDNAPSLPPPTGALLVPPSTPPSRISVEVSPGIRLPASRLPPRWPPLPPNTSARRSASSLALMYLSSNEYSC